MLRRYLYHLRWIGWVAVKDETIAHNGRFATLAMMLALKSLVLRRLIELEAH
jgi:hypothetical protein